MFQALIYPLAFVAVLSLVVFVHEFGHYIVAILFGVKVEEFAIGFGPALFSKKVKSGTVFKLCAIPFGGYIRMFGDGDATSLNNNPRNGVKKLTREEKAESFEYQKGYRKIAIVLAGPVANYIVAFLLMFGVFSTRGIFVSEPIVTGFSANSPAQEAGLKEGDLIVETDGEDIESVGDLRRVIAMKNGEKVSINVLRNGAESLRFTVKPVNMPAMEKGKGSSFSIGIYTPPFYKQSVSLLEALKRSGKGLYTTTATTLKTFAQMVSFQRGLTGIGGPISIAKYSGEAALGGFPSFLMFVAFISSGIGLVNLIPIPIVDGGQAVIYFMEMIIRGKLPALFYSIFQVVGFGLVALLMLIATFNDIKGLLF